MSVSDQKLKPILFTVRGISMKKIILFIILFFSCSTLHAQTETIVLDQESYTFIMSGLKTILDEIDDLKKRIKKLETGMSFYNEQTNVYNASIENWKKLAVGNTEKYVAEVLGEPMEKHSYEYARRPMEKWIYSGGGVVSFKENKVDRWKAPKMIR
jgi:hypothetical protein